MYLIHFDGNCMQLFKLHFPIISWFYFCAKYQYILFSIATLYWHRRIGLVNSILGQLDKVWRNMRLDQSEYETETLHVPCSTRLAAWNWDVDSDQSRLGPSAGFSHEGTTAHPEHKVVWLRHQWFRSEPDKADGSTSHHSWQKTLIAR